MGGIGNQELFLLMLLFLIFFGSKKLPEITRGLGKGMAEFRKAARDVQSEITRELERTIDLKPKKEVPPPESQELTGQDTETESAGDSEGTTRGEAS